MFVDTIRKYLGQKTFRLHIYMKSGNVVVLSNVTDWEIKSGVGVTSFTVTQQRKGNFLVVNSLCLSQIEAVVREY